MAVAWLFATACFSGYASPTPTGGAAEALLHSADSKLERFRSLKAKYVEVDAYPGKYRDLRQTGTVELVRPNLVRLEVSRARRVEATDPWTNSGNDTLAISDGKDRYAVFLHAHSAQVRRADAAQGRIFDEVPILSGFFGGESSPAAEVARAEEAGELASISLESPTSVKYRIGDVEKTAELDESGIVHRLTIHRLKTGAIQEWTLTSLEPNAAVNLGDFHYVPPKDALPYGTPSRQKPLPIGDQAPDFSVVNQAGKTVSLSDFRGKVVVLKFWATWCWPCNQSLPHTNEVAAANPNDVVVLAVAIHDSKKGFDAWLAKHKQFKSIQFAFEDPTKPGPSDVYHVVTTPTEYVIDRDGRIAAAHAGFTGPTPELSASVQKALQAN
jgi:peroxiredoxin